MKLPRINTFLILLLTLSILVVWVSSALAAKTATLGISATVLSKNQCKFNTKNAALAFGSIDTFDSVDVQATASLTFICIGKDDPATFSISHDDGLNESGLNAPRMLNSLQAGEYLPYELSLSSSSGTVPKNVEQTLSITGTVRSSDFQLAFPGSYTDTVTISIFP